MIPGCGGRGVRLGSENSSGGGAWKSEDLEIQKIIWGPGNPEIWGPKNQRNKNYQNSNPFCPKRRQVGKKYPGPIRGHLRPFFPWTGKKQRMQTKKHAYFPWWANGPLFTRFGPLLLSTRGGGTGISFDFQLNGLLLTFALQPLLSTLALALE